MLFLVSTFSNLFLSLRSDSICLIQISLLRIITEFLLYDFLLLLFLLSDKLMFLDQFCKSSNSSSDKLRGGFHSFDNFTILARGNKKYLLEIK